MSTNIGEKVRKIRELKGLTQEYLANQLGVSQRAYSKMERNEVKMSWDKIVSISKMLEVTPEELVSFNDEFIFNNCTQSGKFSNFNINVSELVIDQYEARIKELQEEVLFLRGLVDKS